MKGENLIMNTEGVCAEIVYMGRNEEGKSVGWVHSDLCPEDHNPKNITDSGYREMLHRCLDEWLNKSDGSGHFFVGDNNSYVTNGK